MTELIGRVSQPTVATTTVHATADSSAYVTSASMDGGVPIRVEKRNGAFFRSVK